MKRTAYKKRNAYRQICHAIEVLESDSNNLISARALVMLKDAKYFEEQAQRTQGAYKVFNCLYNIINSLRRLYDY